MLINEAVDALYLQVASKEDIDLAIAHGGITYSLADSALAFASNSDGVKSLSIETSINHLQSCKEGDEITAVAEELNKSEKLAHYMIKVTNQRNELVAIFKGMV